MSNILTSFVRIHRRDRAPMSEAEQRELVGEVCQAYGATGSYWVRIVAAWSYPGGCLDIRFGSSKSMHTKAYILHRSSFFERYMAWERVADEGGFSDTLSHYETAEPAPHYGACRYAFDSVRVLGVCPPGVPAGLPRAPIPGGVALLVGGTYSACNDRTRDSDDLPEDSDLRGPRAQWDGVLGSGVEPPCNGTHLLDLDLDWLRAPMLSGNRPDDGLDALELLYRGRVVQRRAWEQRPDVWEGLDWHASGADGWDNCVNPEWLAFVRGDTSGGS